jgi:hypothetical protein
MPDEEYGDEAYRLGEFIYEQNPYGLNRLPTDLDSPRVKTDGPAKSKKANNPLTAQETAAIQKKPSKSLWWYFNGKPCRVNKAIRIPYTYKVGGRTVTEHLLIGYEGTGGP